MENATPNTPAEWNKFTTRFDKILERGLCAGIGNRDGQMCIEAAICASLDLPHGDNPSCVDPAVRAFKIRLNDNRWSSPEARAKGLRELGIAQVGSKGKIKSNEFSTLVSIKTVNTLLPPLFEEIFPKNAACLKAVKKCQEVTTLDAARAAAGAAEDAARAAGAAAWAAGAAAWAAAGAAGAIEIEWQKQRFIKLLNSIGG